MVEDVALIGLGALTLLLLLIVVLSSRTRERVVCIGIYGLYIAVEHGVIL